MICLCLSFMLLIDELEDYEEVVMMDWIFEFRNFILVFF